MNRVLATLAMSVLLVGPAAADDKDKSGNDRWRNERIGSHDRYRHDGERKEKFRTADGCEVEREWKRDEYEEKIKCKRRRD